MSLRSLTLVRGFIGITTALQGAFESGLQGDDQDNEARMYKRIESKQEQALALLSVAS
jgi:hypothetical protein